ncbi:MAG: hypothetical protein ACRBN8_14430 [Nannocystales bacterium]
MAEHLTLGLAACLLAGCPAPIGPAPRPSPPDPPGAVPDPGSEDRSAHVVPPEDDDPCPHAEGEDAKRFEYDAFGPAAMSFGLLGQAWWQWDSEGHAFEKADGTIWVVVHEGLNGDALATRFPVIQEAQCDQRYVALEDARAYLREHIDELGDPAVPEFGPLRAELQRTLAVLNEHFE